MPDSPHIPPPPIGPPPNAAATPTNELFSTPFDAIFSLGAMCQVASQLKRLGLRRASGPFDWLVTDSLTHVASFLTPNPPALLPASRLVSIGQHGDNLMLRDSLTGFVSVHDFPAARNSAASLTDYPAVSEKLNRRLQRLRAALAQPGARVLFVRAFGEIADQHCENHLRAEFSELLRILRAAAGGQVAVLGVSIATAFPHPLTPWQIDGFQLRFAPDPSGRWEGDDSSWSLALSALSLT